MLLAWYNLLDLPDDGFRQHLLDGIDRVDHGASGALSFDGGREVQASGSAEIDVVFLGHLIHSFDVAQGIDVIRHVCEKTNVEGLHGFQFLLYVEWCPAQDSNLHDFHREILSLLRLPFRQPGGIKRTFLFFEIKTFVG